MFKAADCQLEMHVTERRHHATGELCMPGLRMLEASSCDQLCALAKPCAAFANCGGMAWAKDREAHMCRKPAHGAKAAARLPARPAHYAELVQQVAPGSFDVIVAIGGDGTTHEVLQVGSRVQQAARAALRASEGGPADIPRRQGPTAQTTLQPTS